MIVTFLAALAVGALATPLIIAALKRSQILDIPNSRSSHVLPTPRGGGLAVVAAVIAAMTLCDQLTDLAVDWRIVVFAAAFAVLGLIDDVQDLPVIPRLGVQTGLASTAASLLVGATSPASIALVALATLWIIGFTNAVNFMDGINGISALSAGLAGGWYSYVGITQDVELLVPMGVALVGACVGFLPWNAPRARVFLGDVGSYFLGASLALMAVVALTSGVPLIVGIAPLYIYMLDVSWTLAKRVLTSQSWHEAHKDHVYQRLTQLGWPHWGVNLLVLTLSSLGLLVLDTTEVTSLGWRTFVAVVLGAAYLLAPQITGLTRRRAVSQSRTQNRRETRHQYPSHG